ncbi:TIGR03943 family putative permease subunit [Agromyces aerolatus]|uniref:TIGR03943 family putative permease subunit n=1 Tax=Agromyces sp. LY-1074 TaxID=3074080 RepID=UPI002865622F|nr:MULTISPECIES: TIGR03943 family protein [unclassified Agromyces]MDR5701939.1 TIGR03943 family protein [Agromyces sp. LY-1074]MDR5708166.1 TIGR03943 family protein [Agromyces sp. LY-1358]
MWPRLIERWKGVALTLIGVVATVWLTVTGQLGLYIHPRYFGFTAIMAIVGGVLALLALALVPGRDEEDDHEHEHHPEQSAGRVASASERIETRWAGAEVGSRGLDTRPRPSGATRPAGRAIIGAVLGGVIVVGALVALLVFPPATLTASTAVDRDIDRTTADLAGDAPSLAGADPSRFTVKDWALLLRQTEDPTAFAGQEVALTGFVTPAPGDPDDSFYVARFTVTCCAVDAQPIGVAVHLPGWRDTFEVDDWVEATGGFGLDPAGGEQLVLMPDAVVPTEQPEQPYVF